MSNQDDKLNDVKQAADAGMEKVKANETARDAHRQGELLNPRKDFQQPDHQSAPATPADPNS